MPVAVLILAGSLTAASADEPLRINGPTMGTYYSIVVDTPPTSAGDGSALQTKIEQRLKQINDQMSTWDDASEISAFNQSRSTEWFEVSSEFAAVVAEAKRIHELTDGAFDPTLAPLIDLWGFGDNRPKKIPDESAIAEAKTSVGMKHLTVRLDPPALKKSIPELQVNLSAIAKGYAVDALAELLTSEGLLSFVVDIGGEDRAGLAKASGEPWKLGVESPAGGGLARVMRLTEQSIATSGDYRNFFQVDGKTYSHTIDPQTGWPVQDPPASVSVVHKSCMTADALATAMMVLGAERGTNLARQHNLSVLFQTLQDNDAKLEAATGIFVAAATEPNAAAARATDTSGDSQAADAPQTADVTAEALTEAEGPPDLSPVGTADETSPAAEETARWFPFAAAAVIFLVAVAGMAIGTMLQNKTLKGSCGGLASMPGSDGKSICELCTVPRDECTNAELREKLQAAASGCADDEC